MQTNRDFVLRHVGSLHLLIPARRNDITQSYLSLNDLGTWIWQNAGGKSLAELTDSAIAEFHLAKEDSDSIGSFCVSLIEKGLLVENHG